MKINFVMLIIVLAISALAAFGFYSVNSIENYRLLITFGSSISIFITLSGVLAFSSPHGSSVNIKVVSGVFFIVFLIEQIIFSFININLAPYVIITGILLLVYLIICYGIIKALK